MDLKKCVGRGIVFTKDNFPFIKGETAYIMRVETSEEGKSIVVVGSQYGTQIAHEGNFEFREKK